MLSDEEIAEVEKSVRWSDQYYDDFARAIEAKVLQQDEALLRQCFRSIEDHYKVKDGHEMPAFELWEALKARLGEA